MKSFYRRFDAPTATTAAPAPPVCVGFPCWCGARFTNARLPLKPGEAPAPHTVYPRNLPDALAREVGGALHPGVRYSIALELASPTPQDARRSRALWRRPVGASRPAVVTFEGPGYPGGSGERAVVLVGPGRWAYGYDTPACGACYDLEARAGEVVVLLADGNEYAFSRYARGAPAQLAAWLRAKGRVALAAEVEAVELPRGPADHWGAALGFSRHADYDRVAALARELGLMRDEEVSR